jgi:transposase
MSDATPLPPDLDACHALLREQAQAIRELHQVRQQLSQENEELQLAMQKLLLRLRGHRSERVVDDPNQLGLDFGADPAAQDALADAALEAEQIVQEYTVRRRRPKPKRPRCEKLPAHLPRYEVLADAAEEQQQCPTHGPKQLIGYDVTETLEWERPRLRVRVTKYPKYACPNQPACGVSQAERPTSLVEGNRYDTSLAAEIITAKYGFHLPFYRQQDSFAGSGWTPSRSTLLNILTSAEFVLQPLAEHYRQVLLSSGGLGCDETRVTLIVPPTLPELDPRHPRSRRIHEVLRRAQEEGRPSVAARMWAYRAFDVPVNVFDFTVSRHRDGPDEILRDFTGPLMADCWSGFQKIELRSEARIQRAACWAHARRKVLAGRSSHPQQASVLLAMIRELYDLEDRGKTLAPEARLALRQNESRRVLDRLRTYLASEALAGVLPKSIFAEALNYLRNHGESLNVFVSDARLPIDNNDVEQLMKQVAVGRKNWLFVGSVEAGARAATLLTIVSTAVRNDLDVWAYLKDVLDQLLAGATDYAPLRADVWKQSHPEAIRHYRADERRDQADRQRLHRARRRLHRPRGPSQ